MRSFGTLNPYGVLKSVTISIVTWYAESTIVADTPKRSLISKMLQDSHTVHRVPQYQKTLKKSGRSIDIAKILRTRSTLISEPISTNLIQDYISTTLVSTLDVSTIVRQGTPITIIKELRSL